MNKHRKESLFDIFVYISLVIISIICSSIDFAFVIIRFREKNFILAIVYLMLGIWLFYQAFINMKRIIVSFKHL